MHLSYLGLLFTIDVSAVSCILTVTEAEVGKLHRRRIRGCLVL